MQQKVLLYSKLCELNELSCLVCSLDENEKHDKSAPSNFHHKILKCRLLIFSAAEILASPDRKSDLIIFVIFNKKITDNEKFIEHIHKINLKIIETPPVDLPTYEACLKYTLIAKMSPLWNHMKDNIFIKGRNFLHDSTPHDAVEFNVFVFENAVVLEIKCIKIHLAPINIEDLNISQQMMNCVHDGPGFVGEEFLFSPWVSVLPRLTRGQIKSVNREIPKTSLFDNYKDLKRHWKNCYGYRLPDDDTGIVYYEVHFKYIGPQWFTYPSICLAKNFTIITPSQQSINGIIDSFKTDVNQKLSHILGHSASFDELKLEHVDNLDVYSSQYTVQVLKMNKILDNNRININKPSIQEENGGISNEEVKSVERKEHIDPENNIANDTYFSQKLSLCTPTQNSGNDKKYYPIFTSKKNKDTFSNNYYSGSKLPHMNDKPNIFYDIKNENNTPKLKPMFSSNNVFNRLENGGNRKRNNIAIENNHMQCKETSTNPSQTVASDSGFNAETPKKQKMSEYDKPKTYFRNTPLNGSFENSISCERKIVEEKNLSILKFFKPKLHQQCNIKNNTPKKIKASVSKPVNEILACDSVAVDIPRMANANFESLKKLTVLTLFSWLRSQNVHVTTKMTKQQLLNKIREYLNL